MSSFFSLLYPDHSFAFKPAFRIHSYTFREIRMVRRFTEIKELTAEVVNEFIERIEVGETAIVEPRRFSHWKDEKRQNVRIVYNYIGTVPLESESVTAETREKITATV